MSQEKNYPNLERTFKLLPHHVLFIFFSQNTLTIKLHSRQKPCSVVLKAEVTYSQLPLPLQVNFADLQQVHADISTIDASRISYDPKKGLNIQLQVGSRLRDCLFPLVEQRYGLEEEIQWLLWNCEGKCQDIEKSKANISQVNQLKVAIERQSREVADLAEKLARAFSDIQRLQEQNNLLKAKLSQQEPQTFQSKASQNERIAVLQEKVKQLLNDQQERSKQLSSVAIRKEELEVEKPVPNKKHPDIIPLPHPLSRDKASSISSSEYEFFQKFQLDNTLTNQSQPNSFLRIGKRFKLVKADQKAKMITSLTNLPEPKGKVIFRVISSKNKLIWVGLQLQERLHLPSTKRQADCISYKIFGGKGLFEDSVQSGINMPMINNLEGVSIEVNQTSGRISWSKMSIEGKETSIADRALPLSFRNRQLYPFVTMIDKDDEIEFA